MIQNKGIYHIIAGAVSVLRADPTFGPRLSNKWLPPETWVDALAKSHIIDPSFDFNSKKFNAAMIKSKSEWGEAMLHFDGTNNTGVFRVRFQQQFYYYFTEKGKQVPYPSPLDAAWKERVLAAAANVLIVPTTRSRPAVEVHHDDHDASDHDASEANKGQRTRLSNKWLPTEIWVDVLKKSRLIDIMFEVDCKRFGMVAGFTPVWYSSMYCIFVCAGLLLLVLRPSLHVRRQRASETLKA
jgi:hypothetical protein